MRCGRLLRFLKQHQDEFGRCWISIAVFATWSRWLVADVPGGTRTAIAALPIVWKLPLGFARITSAAIEELERLREENAELRAKLLASTGLLQITHKTLEALAKEISANREILGLLP